MKTIKQIIIDHLESIGAEGLCDPENQCGCDIKDLFPCDNCQGDCVPSTRHVVTKEDLEDLEYDDNSFGECVVGDTVYRVMKDKK